MTRPGERRVAGFDPTPVRPRRPIRVAEAEGLAPLDAEILRAVHHAARAAIAAREGVPMRAIESRWHRLRAAASVPRPPRAADPETSPGARATCPPAAIRAVGGLFRQGCDMSGPQLPFPPGAGMRRASGIGRRRGRMFRAFAGVASLALFALPALAQDYPGGDALTVEHGHNPVATITLFNSPHGPVGETRWVLDTARGPVTVERTVTPNYGWPTETQCCPDMLAVIDWPAGTAPVPPRIEVAEGAEGTIAIVLFEGM